MVVIKMDSIILSNDILDLERVRKHLSTLILEFEFYTKEGIINRLKQITLEINGVAKFLGDHIDGKGGVERISE